MAAGRGSRLPDLAGPRAVFGTGIGGVAAAMAPDGASMVVRARGTGAAQVLEAMTRPPGGAPSSPRELVHGADGRFLVPRQLWAGPDGTFVLAYDDTADTRSIQDSDARIAIIGPDGRRVDQLTPTALDPPLSRKPAFDDRGRVYFAAATRDAKFATYQLFNGTVKSVPVAAGPIPGGAATAGSPDIAVTADDRQLFTYGIGCTSGCTQYSEVWASQDLDGGPTRADKLTSAAFGGTPDPVSGDCGSAHGRVLMASQAYIDAQGAATVFVIELDADAGTYVITSVHRPVNGVWGPRETVATLPRDGTFPLGFWLAGSTPAFSYLREDGDAYVLYWTERNAGGTWQAARTIGRSTALSGFGVAPLPNGGALIVWSEEGGEKRMLARRVLSDGTQPDPIVLASGLADAPELASSAVAVAGDGSGNAIAAVADGDKTRYIGYDGAGPVLDGVSLPSSSASGEARTYSLGSARDVWSAVGTPPAKLKLPAKVRRTKGTYTIALTITDAAGNATTTKTTFRVK